MQRKKWWGLFLNHYDKTRSEKMRKMQKDEERRVKLQFSAFRKAVITK